MRVRVKLTEMKGGKASFVSLVPRAASRIPFRIKKSTQENPMIDLKSVFGKVSKNEKAPEAETPTVVSVGVMKGEYFEALKGAIADSGFNVENAVENEDGTVEFVQVEKNEADEHSMIRLSGDIVLVMKGFSSYSENLKDFGSVLKAQGFHYGLDAATSAFRNVVCTALCDSSNPEEAVQKVDDSIAQFGKYVRGLVDGLPKAAFTLTQKAETAVADAIAAESEVGEADASTADDSVSATESGTEIAAEGAADTKIEKSEESAGSVAQPDANLASIAAAVTQAVMVAVKGELEPLTTQVAGLATQVSEIAAANATLGTQVAEAVQKSETASAQVKGAVIASAAGADKPAGATVVKAENTDRRTGTFDTAYLRN